MVPNELNRLSPYSSNFSLGKQGKIRLQGLFYSLPGTDNGRGHDKKSTVMIKKRSPEKDEEK